MSRRLELIAVILMATAGAAVAQVDPFEFEVYPAQTVGKGMFEIESLNSFVADGHSQPDEGTSSGSYPSNLMYRSAIEVTYGLTEKIEFAAYLNLAKPNGTAFKYAGAKARLRGSLFEPGQLWVDLGWYIELESNETPGFNESAWELDLKPIISKNWGRFEIDLNPKFEKAIFTGPEKDAGFEFGYIVGTYYNFKRWLSPGLEFYGGIGEMSDVEPLDEQQHYVFPVIRGELNYGFEYNFGLGFGLTPGSDQILVKLNLEFEHFLGTLWS